MEDAYNLKRFVDAQNEVYEQVRSELRRGRKSSHWMWFIFPQIQGLGQSPLAVHYAIHSLAEAKSYLQHPTLGLRLLECCDLLLNIEGRLIGDIMGYPDDLKLRSSMTLFSQVASDAEPFLAVLKRYFKNEPDPITLKLLGC